MGLIDRIDDLGKPAWIALTVLSFILFWPVGIALLVYLKWSGRMFCSRRYGHWDMPDRQAAREEWRERRRQAREEWREWKSRHRWGRPASSGNVAFDEYREETLRRLDEEQREFRDFLDKLRAAKDRSEFDQFMSDRRSRPTPPATEPPPAPPAS
ncbi:MAG: DUF2852 domain-containing protein [Reyranella sp.]|jgi:hypothetical protein|uniref:DUF2852 domain-containing protein n=1 Tax=Reyranella sp. TaxID=1929291 RepID=UPI001AD19A63|nr:DUF2852 domain-containing protein [Reyranella sp.]MBN9541685.1 DUF2852 domain-containing protein [Alphaproteobacteria bacterium]MBR2815761.1 DUF2852 domain-containing protein [Reyranella sp.]